MGGNTTLMYFTIQSNIAISIICLCGLVLQLSGKTAGRAGQLIKLMGTVSVTLTGIVFSFVLAPTMGKAAWSIPNTLTHAIVPVAAVLDFFAVAYRYPYQKKDDLWVILPPLAYAFYAGIGYVSGWEFAPGINYPYFFLNWGSKAGAFGFTSELPFMGTAWWILALLLFLLAVGYAYLLIADLIGKRFNKTK